MRSATRKKTGKDRAYLTWLHTCACIVSGERGPHVTAHHVRFCGGPRLDRRAVPLIARLHMLTHEHPGIPCIERLGKVAFERTYEIDLEAEIRRLNAAYDAQEGI